MTQRGNSKNQKEIRKKEKLLKLGLIITILVFAIVIYKIFDMLVLSNRKYNLSGNTYYQYFYGVMEEFSGNMEVFLSDDDIQLKLEDGQVIYLDTTPIYYRDALGKVLFAKEMELVVPDVNVYKLNKFTNIINENRKMSIKDYNRKDAKDTAYTSFLFDGNNLYFFLDQTKIIVGDTEYNVSPLSYAIVNYRESVEIYDYDNDEYIIINDENLLAADIIAKNAVGNYEINMSIDSLTTERSSRLLMKNINDLSEYIK